MSDQLNNAIREVTRRFYTADAEQREASARADLIAKVRDEIDLKMTLDEMAEAAVAVFVDFLRNPPVRTA